MHTLQAKWFFFFTLLKVNYRLIYILAAPVGGSVRRALVQSPSLATAEGARGASTATTAHPPPATPAFVKTPRAPGEGVRHVSPSLPTGTFSFFHQGTTWACESSGPALRPTAGAPALAHPENVAQKGRGHRHQNTAALLLRSGSSSDCSKIQLNLRIWHWMDIPGTHFATSPLLFRFWEFNFKVQ